MARNTDTFCVDRAARFLQREIAWQDKVDEWQSSEQWISAYGAKYDNFLPSLATDREIDISTIAKEGSRSGSSQTIVLVDTADSLKDLITLLGTLDNEHVEIFSDVESFNHGRDGEISLLQLMCASDPGRVFLLDIYVLKH